MKREGEGYCLVQCSTCSRVADYNSTEFRKPTDDDIITLMMGYILDGLCPEHQEGEF